MGDSIPNLKSSHEEYEKNIRMSVDSDCLKLDSLVNLPKSDKKQKGNRSNIDEQS